MSKFPKFAKLNVEEAEARAQTESNAAPAVVASMSGQPLPASPAPVPTPSIEPAQSKPPEASNDANIRDWPLDNIVVHKYNARRLPLSPSQLDKLTQSMLVKQRTPVPAYIDEAGRACLIDGRRRFAAAKNGDMPTLRLEILEKPATDREIYRLSRAYNVEREQQNPLDDALAWKLLLEQGVYKNQKEISEDTGVDEGEVSRIIKLTEFPPRILELLNGQEQLLNLRMLNAIRLYCDVLGEDETKSLIIQAESGELSSRDVDKMRAAHQRAPVPRKRSNTTLNFAFAQGKAQVRQFDSARKVVIEIENVADGLSLSDVTEALKATMRATLGGEPEPQ